METFLVIEYVCKCIRIFICIYNFEIERVKERDR